MSMVGNSPLHIKIIVSLSNTLSILQNNLEFFLNSERLNTAKQCFFVGHTGVLFF